ncbi:MAG TPA: tetratricopeptide repeat protein [Blastocatellia bacterium]|nr:tetratricopeptide repeat protein [Blastocatellia bacterium]
MRKNLKTLLTAALLLCLTTIVGMASQEAKDAAQRIDNRAQAVRKFLEAQGFEKSGNYPAAVAAYKEAVALDPGSSELRVAFGSLYLKSRNVIDAEAQAREALKLAPESSDVRKLLARIYLSQTYVGTNFDKEKARATIKELEEVVSKEPNAKIDVGAQELPALAVVGSLYLSLEDNDKALDALKRVSDTDSSDRAHYMLAQLYYQKGKMREAVDSARKAYDLNQKMPEEQRVPQYASMLAKTLLRTGRTQEALDLYRKTLDIKETSLKDEDIAKIALTSPEMLFDYADALVEAGRYDDATKLLNPVIRNAKKESAPYLNAVRIVVDAQRRGGKREEAVRTLTEALKGQDVSDSLPILFSLAETYNEMEKFDKAIETYEEAFAAIANPDGTVSGREQDKQNAGLMLQRIGFAYRLAGNREKAMETFERMRKVLGADNPRADQLIIDTLMNEGRHKDALEHATKAVAKFPEERSFKLYKAQAAGKLGDMPTAEATLQALLKGGPEDADTYSFLSVVQLEANQLKQAEESARKAIGIDPSDIQPLITLSSIQDRQKKYKDSEATLRRALEIDPENATVLNNLGYFLTERNERLAEAEELIRRAVNIEPTNGSFLDSLGWILFKQGKMAEAQKFLEQAVVYSQQSATIRDHLGDLYKKQGQLDRARAKWEEALKLSTEPEEIKKIKEKLGKK